MTEQAAGTGQSAKLGPATPPPEGQAAKLGSAQPPAGGPAGKLGPAAHPPEGQAAKAGAAGAQDQPNNNKQDKPKWTPPPIPKTVGPARPRRRHMGIVLSFMGLVLVPVVVVGLYLALFAADQFSSIAGFTVRKDEGGSASDFIGGIAQFAGASTASDGDILYEFILSQSLVREIEGSVGLIEHYTSAFPGDPVYALWPDPSIEDLVDYWSRVVRISHDKSSGLIEVRVLAFSPEKAQDITREIVARSQDMINALNERARQDASRYALADLDEAVARLRTAREALTEFRTRTQIVDPQADIQGRMGVMNNLQQQLAEALIAVDLLRDTANSGDPRLTQAQRRIEVIRDRIAEERRAFSTAGATEQQLNDDYPRLLAEFEGLMVDREHAEKTYLAALSAVDVARAKAQRQSRYLATYIEPTLSETSEYPKRWMVFTLSAMFLTLGWAVLALVYYSIRDRG